MTRANLDAASQAQASSASLRSGNLFRFQFPSGTVYATNMGVPVSYNGWTFSPGATVLGWSGYNEASDLKPRGVDFTLSLLPSLVSAALNDNYQNSLVDVWIAFFDQQYAVVGTPYPIAPALRMSVAALDVSDGGGSIRLTCETGGVFFARSSTTLCTDQTQQRRYPGDTSLANLQQVFTRIVDWGGNLQTASNTNFSRGDDAGGGSYGGLTNGLGTRRSRA